MKETKTRVLLLEDNRGDAMLVRRAFEEQTCVAYELTHVERLADALEGLRADRFAVALLDLALPDAFGIEVVERVVAEAPHIAVLVFTVTDDDAMVLQALQKGAQDYLVKSRLDWYTLLRSMRYAIERKRVEQERLAALAHAEAAVRARDSILGIVSHDLRGPLHAISLGALLLREPSLTQDQKVRQLESIQRSAEQMTRLVLDLLDVAKIEAGHLSIHPSAVDTAAVIRDAVELNTGIAVEKGVALETDLPADPLPAVHADRERILQVFYNLLGNAVKFTPRDGRILVSAESAAGEMQFSVTDTGAGIPQEDQARLFDPYWQASRPNRLSAGLGLFITKGVVEAHGGRIWVESKPDQGTTFFFTLPIAPPA